jgi:hypothetical protein
MEKELLAMATATGAIYGAIGIEASFPDPQSLCLHPRSPRRPTTWYWQTLSGSPASRELVLLDRLSSDRIVRTPAGTVFRGWRPGVEQVAAVEEIDLVEAFLADVVPQVTRLHRDRSTSEG